MKYTHLVPHHQSQPSLFDAWYFISFIFGAYLNFEKAAILIFKHATFLCLSMDAESALTQADMDYQAANIDLKIQEHLASSLQEHSVEYFAHFIMTTDIGVFILAYVKITSHQPFSIISVLS